MTFELDLKVRVGIIRRRVEEELKTYRRHVQRPYNKRKDSQGGK